MIAKNFNQFRTACEFIARQQHTFVETREYPEYGWASVAFMTDHFGGVYVNLHYDLKTCEVVNWYGSKMQLAVTTLKQLRELVERERVKLLKSRNLAHICEMINAEYD